RRHTRFSRDWSSDVCSSDLGDAGEPVYYEPSQWTLGVNIGTFAASSFPNPGQTGNDWSWVQVSSGHTLTPTVYGWGQGDATVHEIGRASCRGQQPRPGVAGW